MTLPEVVAEGVWRLSVPEGLSEGAEAEVERSESGVDEEGEAVEEEQLLVFHLSVFQLCHEDGKNLSENPSCPLLCFQWHLLKFDLIAFLEISFASSLLIFYLSYPRFLEMIFVNYSEQ